MRCKICGGKTRETHGVHYLNGRWLLLTADYCHKHGSFVTSEQLASALEVDPDPTRRDHIRPGLHVLVNLKENQLLQVPVEGFVRRVLTKAFVHNGGIRVELSDGRVGRVQKIIE